MASAVSIAGKLRAVNMAAAVGCLLLAGRAGGHPEFNPATTNRYAKLSLVGPERVRLAYTVMLGAAPALAARQAADANHDGKLDEKETRALGAAVAGDVVRALDLRVDGKKISPRFEEPQVGLMGSEVGPSPFSVDLIAPVEAPGPGPHELRFEDATAIDQNGETEIRVEEAPGTRLIFSRRGPNGDEKETRFLFRGPKLSSLEDRSITLSFTGASLAPAASPSSVAPTSRVSLAYVACALGVLAAIAGALFVRRRRR